MLDACIYCPGSSPRNWKQAKRLRDTRQNRQRELALYRHLSRGGGSRSFEGDGMLRFVRWTQHGLYFFEHRGENVECIKRIDFTEPEDTRSEAYKRYARQWEDHGVLPSI